MLQEGMLRLLERAISAGVGGDVSAHVRASGFNPWRRSLSRAACLGAGGSVLEVAIDGWGQAFQRRRSTTQVVVDLSLTPAQVLEEALDQSRTMMAEQMLRAARAALHGVEEPLDRDAFSDPSRLQLDLATARTLFAKHGSDQAVMSWIRHQLACFQDVSRNSGRKGGIDVRGAELRVPFTLTPEGPIEPDRDGIHPVWSGDELVIPLSLAPTADAAERCARLLLARTAATGRRISSVEAFPSPEALHALRRVGAERTGNPCDDWAGIQQTSWRLRLQKMLVPVSHAFG